MWRRRSGLRLSPHSLRRNGRQSPVQHGGRGYGFERVPRGPRSEHRFREEDGDPARMQTGSTMTDVRLLDGMITAEAVQAVGKTVADARRIKGSPSDSTFGSLTVSMLTVVVTQENRFGLPAGSRIVVAHAESAYTRNEPKVIVGGQAYASSADTDLQEVANRAGRTAAVYMGARGPGARADRTRSKAWLSGGAGPGFRAHHGAQLSGRRPHRRPHDRHREGVNLGGPAGITARAVVGVAESSVGSQGDRLLGRVRVRGPANRRCPGACRAASAQHPDRYPRTGIRNAVRA
jgi:hypothetical protein